jgi:hypothetical protein
MAPIVVGQSGAGPSLRASPEIQSRRPHYRKSAKPFHPRRERPRGASIKLVGSALSEPTWLCAQRAMMHNLVRITEFAERTRRIEDLEEKAREREEEEVKYGR